MSIERIIEKTFLMYSRCEPHIEVCCFHYQGLHIEVWGRGILCISGLLKPDAAPRFIFSAGIHGDETAPMEILNALIQEVLTGQLPLAASVLFIFGNIPAINQSVRQVDDNLNRLFCQHLTNPSNPEHQRAIELEQATANFVARQGGGNCLHLDMHTAIRDSCHQIFAIHPYQTKRPLSQQQLLEMHAGGLEAIVFSAEATGTFSCFTAKKLGITSLTVELGKVAPWGKNDLAALAPWTSLLRSYLRGESIDVSANNFDALDGYQVVRTLYKKTPDLALAFAPSIPNFTPFKKGTLLATQADIEYRVQSEDEVVLFANDQVAVGQRVMLLAKPISTAQLLSQLR